MGGGTLGEIVAHVRKASHNVCVYNMLRISTYPGPWEPGGPGGPGPPLKLRFYRVKIFKMRKISFFILVGPPLGKNRSQGPVYRYTKKKYI